MDISWVNIGEFLKAAVPSIIAGVVAWIGIQNWITAKNKLALDLFHLRHAAWRRAVAAIRNGLDELAESDGVTDVNLRRHTDALQEAIEDCYYLFGDEVLNALQEYRDLLLKASRMSDKDPTVTMAFDEMAGRWNTIFPLVEPYMMLDKIAVNRPTEPFTAWFRKRRA